jgi:hypothetical protein
MPPGLLAPVLALAVLAVASVAAHPHHLQEINNRRGALTPGESVPTLRGYALDSKPVVIDYSKQAQPTVVYVISEDGGGYVKRNEANFAALVTQGRGRFKFVILCPVDTGLLAEYIARVRPAWNDVPVTVVANVSEDLRQDMCLFMYPQTLVISTQAKVLQNFLGPYDALSALNTNTHPGTLESFFGIKLPKSGRP